MSLKIIAVPRNGAIHLSIRSLLRMTIFTYFQADIVTAHDAEKDRSQQREISSEKYVTLDTFLFLGNRNLKYSFGFLRIHFSVYCKHSIARTIESLWDLSALFDYFVTLIYEIVYQTIFEV